VDDPYYPDREWYDQDSAGPLNSIGALNDGQSDLTRVFTKDGICSGCSSKLEVHGKDKLIKMAHCTNKKCGKIFTNVVPTAEGMKVINELIEFNDILP
jgi:hypothetical protein